MSKKQDLHKVIATFDSSKAKNNLFLNENLEDFKAIEKILHDYADKVVSSKNKGNFEDLIFTDLVSQRLNRINKNFLLMYHILSSSEFDLSALDEYVKNIKENVLEYGPSNKEVKQSNIDDIFGN